jgi:hypothetical protein
MEVAKKAQISAGMEVLPNFFAQRGDFTFQLKFRNCTSTNLKQEESH